MAEEVKTQETQETQETENKSLWAKIPKAWQNGLIVAGFIVLFGAIIALVACLG